MLTALSCYSKGSNITIAKTEGKVRSVDPSDHVAHVAPTNGGEHSQKQNSLFEKATSIQKA